MPGSAIQAEWREGGHFRFTDASGGVSYGVIRRLVPGEVMHFDHMGDMQDGRESPYADAPRREIYTLSEHGGATRLTLEQDVPSDSADMFREATPRAFARVKELSEARVHLTSTTDLTPHEAKEEPMRATRINPWPNPIFHDAGILIENHRRLLFLHGQCAVSPDGRSLHPGDLRAQMLSALDSLEAVLAQAE